MSQLSPEKIVHNEEGFVLVTALLVLVILVVIGIASNQSTNVEKQISANDRIEKQDFFNQETCLATSKMLYTTWLTTSFITAGETVAAFPPAINPGDDVNGNGINDISEVSDPNGIPLASFETRCMERNELTGARTTIASLSNEANDFPPMSHKDKPPPGSGFSPKNFEVRRFIITCQSPDADRNTVLQEGVYKVFNKF